jgi:hypothetical protein
MMEQAIRFIMDFYQVSWDDAILYYWDEVEAYMKLFGGENE